MLGCAFHAVYSALYNCRRRANVHTVYFYKESNFGKGFGFGKGYGFLFLVKASDSLFLLLCLINNNNNSILLQIIQMGMSYCK